LICFLKLLEAAHGAHFILPAGRKLRIFGLQFGQFLLSLRQLLLGRRILLVPQRLDLDLKLHGRRRTSSSSAGMESFSIRSRDAASSIRSMALSGRNDPYVSFRKHRGGHDGTVGDAHTMVRLISRLQAAQDRDGISTLGSPTIIGWNRRSSAAILSRCSFDTRRACRADRPQLAAGERPA